MNENEVQPKGVEEASEQLRAANAAQLEVLRDLAASNPIIKWNFCVNRYEAGCDYCTLWSWVDDDKEPEFKLEDHSDPCVWRRASVLVAEETTP